MPEQKQKSLDIYTNSADSNRANARERVRQRLANAGLLAKVDPKLVDKYAPKCKERLSPLSMEGKPLSQIVIEERER